MTNKNVVQKKWLGRAALCATLLVVLVVGTGCNLCKIFNCETLFFMEDISQALQNLGSNAGDNADGSDTGGEEEGEGDDHGEEEEEGDEHDEEEGDDHDDG